MVDSGAIRGHTVAAPNISVCVVRCIELVVRQQNVCYKVVKYFALSLVTLVAPYPPINLTTCLLSLSRRKFVKTEMMELEKSVLTKALEHLS